MRCDEVPGATIGKRCQGSIDVDTETGYRGATKNRSRQGNLRERLIMTWIKGCFVALSKRWRETMRRLGFLQPVAETL